MITTHAIRRFQQRFERTSDEAAKLGIEAMLEESRGLTLAEVVQLRRAGVWKPFAVYLFHDYTQMLLVLKFDDYDCEPWVITLFAPDCFREAKA